MKLNWRGFFNDNDKVTKASLLIISGLLLLVTIAVLIGEGVL